MPRGIFHIQTSRGPSCTTAERDIESSKDERGNASSNAERDIIYNRREGHCIFNPPRRLLHLQTAERTIIDLQTDERSIVNKRQAAYCQQTLRGPSSSNAEKFITSSNAERAIIFKCQEGHYIFKPQRGPLPYKKIWLTLEF
ncbi:hypothetical protein KY290_021622 [Solanum tuberosum]|uniref:Uncharacterized protein n=1 Tax=Solanum tuberosum TaxID=4113 RepID=A0ABQ7V225_SOLTU|nr:hypothetical protein KY289_020792 [Solanum tuberosum]KAH0758129.1 hypothetical protein KY290_021622 [Solanum tuberosum]